MDYQDIKVKCVEQTCETPGHEFVVTAGEQSFFASKGYPIPKRCKQCRQNKKNRESSPFKDVAKAFKSGKVKVGIDWAKGEDWSSKEKNHKGKKHQDHRRNGREKFNKIY